MRDETLSIESSASQQSQARVLHLTGPITLENIFLFQDRLRAEESPATILDCTQVPYMDSAGMGAILNFYVSSERRGHKLALAGINNRVAALIKLTKVDTLLAIFPTVEEADKALTAK